MELFEKRFVETNYNTKILMEEFSIEMKTVHSRVKQRGLCKKYPEIRKNKSKCKKLQMSEV